MRELTEAGEVLAAMITPALLISAAGTLVLSTSNRLGRTVDRVRALARDAEQLHRPIDPAVSDRTWSLSKRTLIKNQLTALSRRALLLRSAIAALYAAIGLLVATSMAIGALTSFGSEASWPVIALAMSGAGALLWASVLLVQEGRLAIGSTLEEMQYVHQVVAHVPTADLAAPARTQKPEEQEHLL